MNETVQASLEKQVALQKKKEKKNRVLVTVRWILGTLYLLFGWMYGFLGLFFFSLGLSGNGVSSFFGIFSALLFSLTPVFCILGIWFSALLHKKDRWTEAFLIQFLPFVTLGQAAFLFLLFVFTGKGA